MSIDVFDHADRALAKLIPAMAREFQNLSTQIGFDELNILETRKRVNDMYQRIESTVRREYAKVARKAYMDAMTEAGKLPGTFDNDAFVNGALKAYDAVSDFVFVREWIRKRDRLFESIIANGDAGNQEMRKALKRALDLLANQVRQYADNIAAKARVYAFMQAGADTVVWITEKDEKVCEVCAPRDEQFYPIELLPDYPAHWHCRCQIEIVDMEEKPKQGKWKRFER